MMETKGDTKFTLRPTFVGWIALLVQLPFQLFFTLWSGGFSGGITMMHVRNR